jgi:hypothetical protein
MNRPATRITLRAAHPEFPPLSITSPTLPRLNENVHIGLVLRNHHFVAEIQATNRQVSYYEWYSICGCISPFLRLLLEHGRRTILDNPNAAGRKDLLLLRALS